MEISLLSILKQEDEFAKKYNELSNSIKHNLDIIAYHPELTKSTVESLLKEVVEMRLKADQIECQLEKTREDIEIYFNLIRRN